MSQPVISIQDSLTNQHLGRLWFNRNPYMTLRYFGVTTNNTVTEIFIDGVSGNQLKFPNNSVITVYGVGAGFQSSGTPAGGGALILASCMHVGGTVTLMANQTVDVTPDSGATSTPSVAADNTNKALAFRVTGIASQTVYHEYIVTVALASLAESNYGALT